MLRAEESRDESLGSRMTQSSNSLLESRNATVARIVADERYVAELRSYYDELLTDNGLEEEREMVDIGLAKVAEFYQMEKVRLNHDIARYLRGWGAVGSGYGDSIWVATILEELVWLRECLVQLTRAIKWRAGHAEGRSWHEVWSDAIELELWLIKEHAQNIKEDGEYLQERFIYGGEV